MYVYNYVQTMHIDNFLSWEETLASHVPPDKGVLFAALFCAVVQLKTR